MENTVYRIVYSTASLIRLVIPGQDRDKSPKTMKAVNTSYKLLDESKIKILFF